MKKGIVFSILMLTSTFAFSAEFTSFDRAKKALYTQVYPSRGFTVYTGCAWHIKNNKKVVDLESCGLQDAFPKKQMARAKRLEAEHVLPASWMLKKNGKWRPCVAEAKQKGEKPREYCQDHDPEYNEAHNSLLNLFPSVGQINGDRSNKPYAESISGGDVKTYRGQGEHGRTITITSRVAIPPKKMRGDFARIAFYYESKFGVELNARQKEMFAKWDREDPVSAEEIDRNRRIKRVTGIGNPFVEK